MSQKGNVTRRDIYDFVKEYYRQHKYCPALDDIADGLGMSKSGVYYHVMILVGVGLITREPCKSRTFMAV